MPPVDPQPPAHPVTPAVEWEHGGCRWYVRSGTEIWWRDPLGDRHLLCREMERAAVAHILTLTRERDEARGKAEYWQQEVEVASTNAAEQAAEIERLPRWVQCVTRMPDDDREGEPLLLT